MKSLGFAKSLMKDLEIAANFSIRGTSSDLLQVLRSSDHTQVSNNGSHTGTESNRLTVITIIITIVIIVVVIDNR